MNPLPEPSSLRRLLAAGCLLLASLQTGLPAAESAAKSFRVPAGPAETSLRQFASQSGAEVLFATLAIGRVRTNEVRGEFTVRAALDRLLAGTGLVAEQDTASNTWTFSSDPTAARAAPVATGDRPNARVAPESTSAGNDANDAVLLSPFTVASEKDSGYAATETLAGTRMRTDLRDVGASLTVLTPQFLKDLAVNSFEQALLYTPSVDSVEGDNTDANRASGTQMRFGTGQSYSIRGFVTNAGNQSISHDFFSALEPTDNYNLERLTLALGPNALLIGVGNPQGTAITTTKRAQLQRRKTTVEFQTDRWGSARLAVDHNQPLIKDRLAMRLNLLHDQHREFRRYEGKDQERMTVTVAARPFPNTTVTLNHENYSLHTNASSLMWGFDGSVLRWTAAGKPTVDFLNDGQTWTATRPYVDASGNRIKVAPGVVDADGFVDAKSDFDPNNVLLQNTAHQQTWMVGLNLPNPLVNTRFQGQLQAATFGGIASANYQSMNPWALLGLKKDTNLNGGTWNDPSAKQHGRWTQLLIEQKLADGFFLELGGNAAVYHQNLDPNNFTAVTIDPNRYLPDGSPNPGYLVPYNFNAQMQFRVITHKSADYRTTLSYERDLTKVHGWLGKHNLAALYQMSRSEAAQDLTRVFNLATVGRAGAGWSGDAVNAASLLDTRVYFVNGRVPTMPDSVQVQKHLALLNSYGKFAGATANEAAPINLSRQSFLNAIKSKFLNDSLSLGWQGKWLRDRLVTVVGFRQDDTKSYSVPTVRSVVLPAIPGAATDPLKQYFTPAADIPFNARPSIVASGISRTYGAVFHAFSWLSLTYNRSSNFLPVPDASWKNALGESAPNSVGKTQEYGRDSIGCRAGSRSASPASRRRPTTSRATLGTWRNLAGELSKVSVGQPSALFDLNPASSTAQAQAAADALFITQQADAQEKSYLDDQALTGITTARNGKYAVNGLVTRVFHEGRLKGWSVGGNFRWRSANTIGYERLLNAAGTPDRLNGTRPIRGKEYWDLGAMVSYQRRLARDVNLRVQLNIQNLPNWQEPRLVKSDYDTAGAYGTVNTIVPVLWEMRRPRNFILTSTFEF